MDSMISRDGADNSPRAAVKQTAQPGQLSEQKNMSLRGLTVAVTAARKAQELIALLERYGATVVHAPALQTVILRDHLPLHQACDELVNHPPNITIVTTGIGFRTWMDAAQQWGLYDQLRSSFQSGTIITRGPKASGAVRSHGLVELWSPESEESAELVDTLIEQGVQGKRIAVQLHGATEKLDPHVNVTHRLSAAGAQVISVPVYQWELPKDQEPLHRLVADIIAGKIQAVTFTSAPAVLSVLDCAQTMGVAAEFAAALRGQCLAVCVGPVTAHPLEEAKIPSLQPERSRLVAMVNQLVSHIANNSGLHDSIRTGELL